MKKGKFSCKNEFKIIYKYFTYRHSISDYFHPYSLSSLSPLYQDSISAAFVENEYRKHNEVPKENPLPPQDSNLR